jgi:hypothetical protein
MNASQRDILLVGSLGLESAEAVFRTVSSILGARVRQIPDGETGIRTSWIHWNRPVFDGNPALEPDPAEQAAGRRLTSATEGIRRWGGGKDYQTGAPPPPRLRVRDGVRDIAFEPLGHGEHAKRSYALFRTLRAQGAIRPGTRFQVSIPTVAAMMNGHIVPACHATVEAPLTRRLFADVADLCKVIPHDDLVLQWDIPCELSQWEGVRPAWYEQSGDALQEGIIARLARHCDAEPADVQLGIHFCYGSYGGRHWKEPADTAVCVEVHNRVADRIARPLDYIHLPVPIARDDEAYFAPLSGLQRRPQTALYLGLIHDQDGVEGTRRRIAAAETSVSDFGIATECGFGRRPPATIPELLKLHALI